jgi:hypothetical protein
MPEVTIALSRPDKTEIRRVVQYLSDADIRVSFDFSSEILASLRDLAELPNVDRTGGQVNLVVDCGQVPWSEPALVVETGGMIGIRRSPQHVFVSKEKSPPEQRINFQRIEYDASTEPLGFFLGRQAKRALQGSRYLPIFSVDMQLQQFIADWCGIRSSAFDLIFTLSPSPLRIVETGCIRMADDFAGAGFFTYIAGLAVMHRRGASLVSVDIDTKNVKNARKWTAMFGKAVEVVQGDSVGFLRNRTEPIDLLYLDSLDTTHPRSAEHCLEEFEAAKDKMADQSLVAIDDTNLVDGVLSGKGRLLVPRLLDEGWMPLHRQHTWVFRKRTS